MFSIGRAIKATLNTSEWALASLLACAIKYPKTLLDPSEWIGFLKELPEAWKDEYESR